MNYLSSIEVQKQGFQDQEAWTLVENEERSVGKSYVSTAVFASVQDSLSNMLQRNYIVIKVLFFELPLPIKKTVYSLGTNIPCNHPNSIEAALQSFITITECIPIVTAKAVATAHKVGICFDPFEKSFSLWTSSLY